MKYLLSLFITLLLLSCDPAKRIQMKNNSGADAEIIWTIKEDSIHKSGFYISNSKELKFALKPSKPYNEVMMTLGIGTWSMEAIKNCADDLESLVIRSSKAEVKLETVDAITEFLLARRKGFGKSKIEILVE
jgi:hypothetical protein